MTIDFASFTPAASLAGGVMIGIAALLLMLLHGRVMGISGILGGLVRPTSGGDVGWRVLFVFGALLGPLIVIYLLGRPVAVQPVADGMLLPVAGFLSASGRPSGRDARQVMVSGGWHACLCGRPQRSAFSCVPR